MKRIFLLLLTMIICLPILSTNVYADSPPATLTVDGVLIGSYPSVQAAVDAVVTTIGSNFVIEIAAGTVTDQLNIAQQPNKNVVVKPQPGATVTFKNTIVVDGNGNLNSPETLLIQGLNFDLSSGTPENCIHFNLIPPRVGYCYPHNVTINGCTFKGVLGTTVAVQSVGGGSRNIAILNCTATNMHSLAQFRAVSGYAFVQNCTLSNSENGVNFYGPGNLVIDSNKLEVQGYAVRSGQSSGSIITTGSVTINNSILKSDSTEDGTLVLRGDSTNNIIIIHSTITNANVNGAGIQNLNEASEGLYKIDIVESDINGHITGIIPSTIAVIDDPNVPNGPVSINGNGSDDNILSQILRIILTILLIILLIILIPLAFLFNKIKSFFCKSK
ncbi:hypothetical protein [Acetivibrio mesophilus]|uniref:Right handed beta helix domain-containing protein n=1 Tax=Acetivibrio mesophilus TaxID=2487273 RepID=A0A4Q0I0N9_9FIRM|nr:hypothetical protein [Acetivibrio mesophilus]RXE57601.1 hypothetical protein EFD62_16850 [Acetivibrio mesophilus]